ncbi:MAG: NAD(P)-binding domain-containing protein [Myxococcales bacterium]|nr:NAD(P)-binding domain-containing protein [Myxococcales bacterium]
MPDAPRAPGLSPKPPPSADVLVIGAGQAGLAVGYHLARLGLRFVLVDANERVGDPWRRRWDSLRLFTPARYDALPGLPFPAHPDTFPTKDAMADYLEGYASRFELPVHTGVRVQRLAHRDRGYVAETSRGTIQADQVVVAMANYQRPWAPAFAADLDRRIVQLHSAGYRSPRQLQDGPVLIVGAGNSGAELAAEIGRDHPVWMSGRHPGELPFKVTGLVGRLLLTRLVLRVLFHRVLTTDRWLGRKMRPKIVGQAGPLIRIKSKDLTRLEVRRVPRTTGVRDGRPQLEDGRVLDVANVLWCTGFHPGFSWIDLPIFDHHGEPRHASGLVPEAPGLYFVGLHFLHAMSSSMIHGVGRDAARIAERVAAAHPARSSKTGPARDVARHDAQTATRR